MLKEVELHCCYIKRANSKWYRGDYTCPFKAGDVGVWCRLAIGAAVQAVPN